MLHFVDTAASEERLDNYAASVRRVEHAEVRVGWLGGWLGVVLCVCGGGSRFSVILACANTGNVASALGLWRCSTGFRLPQKHLLTRPAVLPCDLSDQYLVWIMREFWLSRVVGFEATSIFADEALSAEDVLRTHLDGFEAANRLLTTQPATAEEVLLRAECVMDHPLSGLGLEAMEWAELGSGSGANGTCITIKLAVQVFTRTVAGTVFCLFVFLCCFCVCCPGYVAEGSGCGC